MIEDTSATAAAGPDGTDGTGADGATGYVYEPPVRRVVGHLRSYPRHYGALALWLVAMVLAPSVASGSSPLAPPSAPAPAVAGGSDGGAGSTADGPGPAGRGEGTVPASSTSVLAGAAAFVGEELARRGDDPAPRGPAPAPSGSQGDGEGPADDGDGLVPAPGGGGSVIPPPPALPLPPVPEELRPLLAAVTPLTSQGCSAIGLVAVVAAVAGPAAGDAVPVAELMPYLAPAYAACATFPPPAGDPTICAVDEEMRAAGYPADVSGLTKTPNVIGMGVDVLMGIEAAIEVVTGQSLGLAAALYDTLGCRPDA